MLTSRTPFISETKWQIFLYHENIEKKNNSFTEDFLFVLFEHLIHTSEIKWQIFYDENIEQKNHFLTEVFLFVKLMFSKKATKIEEIFTVDLTLCSKCQIDGEDFVNFCGLLRKHELYESCFLSDLKISKKKSHVYLRLEGNFKDFL